jgi:hypothetical protein
MTLYRPEPLNSSKSPRKHIGVLQKFQVMFRNNYGTVHSNKQTSLRNKQLGLNVV